jgi:hypothetical protein
MRVVLWIASAATLLLPWVAASAAGDGLATNADRLPWAQFQARIGYGAGVPAWRADFAPAERSGLKVGGLNVMGDVFLFGSRQTSHAPITGFHATSGLIIGSRSPWLGTGATPANGWLATDRRLFGSTSPSLATSGDGGLDASTVPYIGIGYSNLWPKSGWSVSADLGVVSQNPSNVARFGRVFGGSQSLDDVVRDMRLAPLVQLGVSYSF